MSRKIRFNLRFVLLAFFSLSLLLAGNLYLATKQQTIVNWIEQQGGSVQFGDSLSNSWPERLFRKHFSSVVMVDLCGSKSIDLSIVADLNRLDTLYLEDSKVLDLSPISSIKNLGFLSLRNSDVTKLNGISRTYSLKYLDISKTKVSNIEPIHGLSDLKILDIRGTSIPEHQIIDFKMRNPGCEIKQGM